MSMNRAEVIIQRFGSQSELARLLGIKQSTVQYWASKGRIPPKWHGRIVQAGSGIGLYLSELECGPTPHKHHVDQAMEKSGPVSPFAKWRGQIELMGESIDCYVLDTGKRLIALRSAVKAISDTDSGNIVSIAGGAALRPYVNLDLITSELEEFSIPGTQLLGRGMTTEHFELICRGFVQALYEKAPLTDRQREMAVKCAVITSGLTRTGIDALIDEATGYQYERAEDALQVKLRAFIAEELRAWEKTFPDELWEEFGRLTSWSGSLNSRPKYWGKLVIELIYDTLDPDVAKYLRENRPPPGIRWHQNLSEDTGVRALVSRCYEIIGLAKSCQTMRELQKKVAHHYGKQKMLFNVYDQSS